MTRAVVVGSGPNGLAAAVRLAQAGLDVEVLEAATEIGGGTRSSELMRPGVLHDHCSAFHPLGVASPFLASLPLERYGLRWRWPEIDCAHPLDDGTAGLLYRDLDATARALGADGARWKALFGPLAARMDDVAVEILRPVAHLPRHPLVLARTALRVLPPATILARYLRTPQARALLTGMAAHGFTRLDRPGSSAAGVMLVAAGHRHGWPVAQGGSSSITAALAALLGDLGGHVHTGVHVRDRADLADADVVVLDVLPEAAAQILGDAMPRRIRRTFGRRRPRAAAFKVDYVIDGEVGWTAPGCERAGTVHLGGTYTEIADAERQVLAGTMPQRPFTLVGQQWLADPGRAAGNLHPLWAYAHVPAGYDGPAAEAITAQIERFAPGFAERIVDMHVTSPAQLAQDNPNNVAGDIGGGPNDLLHLVVRPRATVRPYGTGVDGVYLCSSSTPPGGGVHGMCGFHAAGVALADLDR
ncbi:putative FAD dependent oxidoreductase [Gordonia polyisoprenivorans VH2]|uniref:Putative FAD dependent oxidoreductase n=1 Tax=Gordonia polyisoprenivorans (strain DSM 44266 / VH2) TaxID=1112204 RepID=H6MU38_GORPV|nr:NAD(P)/FAD-dependent oxidoreductase [Gordonia polyisoprenivorans]AFA71515.1 putative FAD dependent oxidoreductase [Gordonia polyisoprenivorans VH2]WCB37898.1 NAD(P)/FAD-dependent oxidoreductase [Gordonia polyisoprenivorans]HCS58262.1 NAD(P)/FAD-dependent oxidoreductase [Gordonia polyisoprenivorans]